MTRAAWKEQRRDGLSSAEQKGAASEGDPAATAANFAVSAEQGAPFFSKSSQQRHTAEKNIETTHLWGVEENCREI